MEEDLFVYFWKKDISFFIIEKNSDINRFLKKVREDILFSEKDIILRMFVDVNGNKVVVVRIFGI